MDIDPKVLIHFGGTYSLGHFKQRCEDMTREEMVTAILIPDDKSMPVREVFVGTEEAELIDGICDHLGRSKDADDNLRISHVDGRTRMNRERKYEMYHAKNSSAAVKNQRATQLLRSDVFGPAIIVQQTTEHGRRTPRLCSYTLAEYDTVFTRKKKASAPASGDAGPVALTNEEFKKMKVEMQDDASSVEAKFSAQAVPPQELARSKPMPLKSGQQLAKEYPPPEPAVPRRLLARTLSVRDWLGSRWRKLEDHSARTKRRTHCDLSLLRNLANQWSSCWGNAATAVRTPTAVGRPSTVRARLAGF